MVLATSSLLISIPSFRVFAMKSMESIVVLILYAFHVCIVFSRLLRQSKELIN